MNFKDAEFKAQAIANFKDVKKVLDDLHIPFFLSNGTLLGCIREKDLIPHDSDIDLGIFIEDLDNKEDLIKGKLLDLGFHLFGEYGTKDNGYELSFKRKAKIDLFFYYHDENGDTMSVYGTRPQTKYVYPRINPLITTEFLGELVFIPYDFEAYLTAQYGDWRTPVTEWNYETSIKNGQY